MQTNKITKVNFKITKLQFMQIKLVIKFWFVDVNLIKFCLILNVLLIHWSTSLNCCPDYASKLNRFVIKKVNNVFIVTFDNFHANGKKNLRKSIKLA